MRRLTEALQCLNEYYTRTKPSMHYPFILRATGASTAWMSPSQGERVCYIGFLVYLSEESYSGNTDRLKHLAEIETLLAQFEAVPHYGKFFNTSNYNFAKLLPNFGNFVELRKRVDPFGRFLNPFLMDLLGATPAFANKL
jgi:D-arabinono-1,4-lactone oxidase